MNNQAIILKNITKEYFLEKPRTLKKWFKTLLSPFDKFTVIKNFSLEVNKGDFIVITGANGSGKSTLLRIIAGITKPDRGTIRTNGRIVPLIELGAGFNFDLSGKENVLINATILGVSKTKLKKNFPKIVEFSGVGNFINIPLKRYSSGMVSRLAFSIAAFSEPDILLLDEVFAVGDSGFRKKTFRKLKEFNKNKVTILLTTNLDLNLPFKYKHIKIDK